MISTKKHSSILFNKDIFYLLLLIPIFEPDIFKSFTWSDNLFIIMKFLVLVVVGYKYCTLINVGKFSYYIILYCSIFILSTIVNEQDLMYTIKKIIECIVVSMLIEVGIYYKGIKMIKILFEYLLLLTFVNVILFIPFPKGLLTANQDSENYKMYFLCIKNGMINWMILGAVSGIICRIKYKSREFNRKYNIFLILATISIFYTKSSTGIIIWTLFLIFFLMFRVYKYKLNLKNIILILIILYIGIVFFRIQEYFNDLFILVFNKDASLTGRTNLWDYAIMYIKESPIIGYGIRENSIINFYGRSYTSHNFALELLLSGGIIQLIVFFIIIIVLVKSIDKCQSQILKSYMTFAFVLFFIATLVGAPIYNTHWISLWVIIYYTRKFGNLIIER